MIPLDLNEPLSKKELASLESRYLNADALFHQEHVRIKKLDRWRRAFVCYPEKRNHLLLLVDFSELLFIT